MWWLPEIAYGALGAGMVLAGGARIWWARRQPLPGPSADERQWAEVAEVVGTPVHEYRGYE